VFLKKGQKEGYIPYVSELIQIEVITAMRKRADVENNTPDNKARHTGLVVHVLPQEKLNIDDISDVFIHFNG